MLWQNLQIPQSLNGNFIQESVGVMFAYNMIQQKYTSPKNNCRA